MKKTKRRRVRRCSSIFLHSAWDWSSTGIPVQIQGNVSDRHIPAGLRKCTYGGGVPQITATVLECTSVRSMTFLTWQVIIQRCPVC